jgi:hypothetical protein
VPYKEYTNKEIKKKLIALDNKVVQKRYTWAEREKWFREFLKIFE